MYATTTRATRLKARGKHRWLVQEANRAPLRKSRYPFLPHIRTYSKVRRPIRCDAGWPCVAFGGGEVYCRRRRGTGVRVYMPMRAPRMQPAAACRRTMEKKMIKMLQLLLAVEAIPVVCAANPYLLVGRPGVVVGGWRRGEGVVVGGWCRPTDLLLPSERMVRVSWACARHQGGGFLLC
ncbi:hypothetical protein IWX90DRAFT_60698 [Phyllosticta citrichinensis]|uniref:Uncharacterized protein n=1 Tax=Phyllosticta citrichinensis TaxID=1130410 RepID=A0ABR1XH16_9PEZI